jgi:hypothetical protein
MRSCSGGDAGAAEAAGGERDGGGAAPPPPAAAAADDRGLFAALKEHATEFARATPEEHKK